MNTFEIIGTVPVHLGDEFLLPVDNAEAFDRWLQANRVDTIITEVGGKPGVKMRGSFAKGQRHGRKIRYTIEARTSGTQRCIFGLKVRPY